MNCPCQFAAMRTDLCIKPPTLVTSLRWRKGHAKRGKQEM